MNREKGAAFAQPSLHDVLVIGEFEGKPAYVQMDQGVGSVEEFGNLFMQICTLVTCIERNVEGSQLVVLVDDFEETCEGLSINGICRYVKVFKIRQLRHSHGQLGDALLVQTQSREA